MRMRKQRDRRGFAVLLRVFAHLADRISDSRCLCSLCRSRAGNLRDARDEVVAAMNRMNQ